MALEVTTKTYNGKEYKNVNLADIDYATSATLRLSFDKCIEKPSKYINERTGKPKMMYSYKATFIEPDIGEVSFIAKEHTHRDLSAYKKGDVLKLTAYERKMEVGEGEKKKTVKFKAFKVEKVALSLSQEDEDKIVEAVKGLPEVPSEENIKSFLSSQGITNADDINRLLTRLKQ